MKQCNKCKIEYPATTEYFCRRSSQPDGLNVWCKSCKKEYDKQYLKTPQGKKVQYKSQLKYSRTSKGKNSYKKYYNDTGKQTMKQYTYNAKGVYGIFSEGKCLYIGETSRVNGRFNEHKTFINNPYLKSCPLPQVYKNISQHKHPILGVIEETENHKEREKYYINKYQPLYNNKI